MATEPAGCWRKGETMTSAEFTQPVVSDPHQGISQQSDVTFRVLPLLANGETLRRFCDGYLNFEDWPYDRFEPFEFEVKGPGPASAAGDGGKKAFVFMVVATSRQTVLTDQPIGWWPQRQILFTVPLAWHKRDGTLAQAVMTPFVFADSATSLTNDREIFGWPAARAWIRNGPDRWLDDRGPELPPILMQTDAMVFRALGVGLPFERRRILEVFATTHADHDAPVPGRPPLEAPEIVRDGSIIDVVKTVLEGSFFPTAINLKQFRDVVAPDRACYQALVLCHQEIGNGGVNGAGTVDRAQAVAALRPPERCVVRFHEYPSLPIATQLGIQVDHYEREAGVNIACCETLSVWAHFDSLRQHAERLCWRAGAMPWQPG